MKQVHQKPQLTKSFKENHHAFLLESNLIILKNVILITLPSIDRSAEEQRRAHEL